jgi:tRNA nucleotidyltransferase (CCA-adding enzyme)
MAVCAGTKRDRSRCTATVEPPQTYCWWHDPDNADERRRAASKAGRSRPNRELVSVKAQLQDLTRDVLAGDLERSRAAVANQLINTRLRAIEQERKNRESDELEARIEALELTQKKGGPRWRGA